MKILVLMILICSLAFGAYIKPKTLKWDANTAADWSYTRVQIADPSIDLNCIVPINPYIDVVAPALEYVLPGVFDLSVEKQYKILVCAGDSNGNISDGTELLYTFDFTCPPAMTNVRVE